MGWSLVLHTQCRHLRNSRHLGGPMEFLKYMATLAFLPWGYVCFPWILLPFMMHKIKSFLLLFLFTPKSRMLINFSYHLFLLFRFMQHCSSYTYSRIFSANEPRIKMHATKWNNDNFLQPLLLFFSLFSHSKLHASMMPLRGWMFAWTKVRNDLLIPFFQTTAVRLHCFFLPWICGEKTWMKKENIRMSSVLKNNFNWQYSSCRYAAPRICSFTMVYKQWSDGSRNWWKIRVKKILFIKECLRVNEKNSFSLRKYFCFVTKSQLNLQHRNIIFGDMALMSQPRIIILHRGMRHANEARRRLLWRLLGVWKLRTSLSSHSTSRASENWSFDITITRVRVYKFFSLPLPANNNTIWRIYRRKLLCGRWEPEQCQWKSLNFQWNLHHNRK